MKTILDLNSEIKHNLGDAPNTILLNESWERFQVGKSKKAGWLVGKTWSHNNKEFWAATYGSWNLGIERFRFLSWDKDEELKNPGLKKELELLSKKADAEIKKEQVANKKRILDKFQSFKPLESADNRYLAKKMVTSYQGLYLDSVNNLVVPIYESFDKKIAGYQTVFTTHKSFPSGQKVQGNFFYYGDVQSADFVYLCEGIATAATIFEVTKIPTISCFQANNMPHVIKRIKNELRGKNVVIACDNDPMSKMGTKAGIDFAMRAKSKFGNAVIIQPDFGSEITAFTDYNDLFVSKGFDETHRQLKFDPSDFVTVDFLGRNRNGVYFFYSSREKTLREATFEKIRAGVLCDIAKDNWWAQRFVPIYLKDKESGEMVRTERTNWKATAELIAEKQQAIGFYDPSNIRGMGSWVDGKHHVLNLGDRILVNGVEESFGRSKNLRKFYTPSDRTLVYTDSYTNNFLPIKKAIDLVDFKSERDRIICLGYLAFAQIFSTQKWRPHLWIRADRGSGKSSLLGLLNDLIQNSMIIQDSTAAGVRQAVASDSCVCLVDEAEGEQYRTKQLLEIARHSSSGANSSVLRGTTTGEVIRFKPELSFVFASIRSPDLTPADESRIIDIFLSKNGESCQSRNQERVAAFYDAQKLSHDLFTYVNKNLEIFNIGRETIHKGLMNEGQDARFADQYAPILAGYMLLYPDSDLLETARVVFSDMNNEEDQKTDSEDFYDILMQIMIKVDKTEWSLGMTLNNYRDNPTLEYMKKALLEHGIHYLPNIKAFCFSKNIHLKNVIARQSNYKNYWSAFKTNPRFEYKNNGKEGKSWRLSSFIF